MPRQKKFKKPKKTVDTTPNQCYSAFTHCLTTSILKRRIKMDKTFTIVGVSTQGKITKFRVANGDPAQREKVLARNGHTDIKLIQLPGPLSKTDAIAAYKAEHPEVADIRLPNEKDQSNKTAKTKTITLNPGTGQTVADAANELLKAVEEA